MFSAFSSQLDRIVSGGNSEVSLSVNIENYRVMNNWASSNIAQKLHEPVPADRRFRSRFRIRTAPRPKLIPPESSVSIKTTAPEQGQPSATDRQLAQNAARKRRQ